MRASPSSGRLRTGKKFSEVVVHTSHAEIGLALGWPAHVLNLVIAVVQVAPKFDDRKDEVVWLVERIQYLVLCDRDCGRALSATFDLDEAEAPRPRHSAFNIV